MVDGALSVTMNGMRMMQLLHADNWDIPHGVSSSDQKHISWNLMSCSMYVQTYAYTYMKA